MIELEKIKAMKDSKIIKLPLSFKDFIALDKAIREKWSSVKVIETKEELERIKLPLSLKDYLTLDKTFFYGPIKPEYWPMKLHLALDEIADAYALMKWGES